MFRSILLGSGVVLAILLTAYVFRLVYLVQTTPAPASFGRGEPLSACPTNKPNCVSSLNSQPEFQGAPFNFSGGADTAMTKLKAAIATEPRVEIVFADATRLDVTFKTALFGFRDDASFAIHLTPVLETEKQTQGRIDFHSKSRVGYSDLGVNRKRIERIRAAFAAAP
jgi:uncharacterized protein (DUF1499 family)